MEKVKCISDYVDAEEPIRTEIEVIMHRKQDEKNFKKYLKIIKMD
ncbi:MAG TPA: hypothetical protein VGC17_05855 [Lactovum miscens]